MHIENVGTLSKCNNQQTMTTLVERTFVADYVQETMWGVVTHILPFNRQSNSVGLELHVFHRGGGDCDLERLNDLPKFTW